MNTSRLIAPTIAKIAKATQFSQGIPTDIDMVTPIMLSLTVQNAKKITCNGSGNTGNAHVESRILNLQVLANERIVIAGLIVATI